MLLVLERLCSKDLKMGRGSKHHVWQATSIESEGVVNPNVTQALYTHLPNACTTDPTNLDIGLKTKMQLDLNLESSRCQRSNIIFPAAGTATTRAAMTLLARSE